MPTSRSRRRSERASRPAGDIPRNNKMARAFVATRNSSAEWPPKTTTSRAIALSSLFFLSSVMSASGFTTGVPHAFLGKPVSALHSGAPTPLSAQCATTTMSVRDVWKRTRSVFRLRAARSARSRQKWGQGMWDQLKTPPAGRAHDEVTFRSGCEGRTLTIPQGDSTVWR